MTAIDVREETPGVLDNSLLLQRYLSDLAGGRNLSRFTLRNYDSDLRHYFGWLEGEDFARVWGATRHASGRPARSDFGLDQAEAGR